MEKANRNLNRKIRAVCLLVLVPGLVFLISGCASPGPLAIKQASYTADQVDAPGLFAENCAVCHGQNGRAHNFHGILVGAQNLTDADWQMETMDEAIVRAIQAGPGLMPAFDGKLSLSEIEALAKYVRTFKPAQ